jgi:hypothetical protein
MVSCSADVPTCGCNVGYNAKLLRFPLVFFFPAAAHLTRKRSLANRAGLEVIIHLFNNHDDGRFKVGAFLVILYLSQIYKDLLSLSHVAPPLVVVRCHVCLPDKRLFYYSLDRFDAKE